MRRVISFIFIFYLLVGCQNTPYYSTNSKGAPMSYHESKQKDDLYEIYQSVRTLFIIITNLAFFVDVGVVIYQMVVNGSTKKGLLALLALLLVINVILLIFQ